MLADQVMVGMLAHDLILGVSAAQVGLADYLQIVQSFQCAVYSREVHVVLVKSHLIVDLFDAGVAFQLAKRSQDNGPLAGYPKAVLPNAVREMLKGVHLLLLAYVCK
jgi:hypothetical protein